MLKDGPITSQPLSQSPIVLWLFMKLACCTFVSVLANCANAQYVFDDGGTHVIDHVDIEPGDTGTAIVTNGTTVIANELNLFQLPDDGDTRGLSFSVTDGTLDVNGGFIGPTVLDDARLNLRGGVYAESDDLRPRSFITGSGNSELRIEDGALTSEFTPLLHSFNAVTIEDQSELFMSGGDLTGVTAIWSFDQSSATITGGTIVGYREAAILEGDSQLTVLGGDVQLLEDENVDRSSLYIARENSSLFLLGGQHGTSHSFLGQNLIHASGSSSVRVANVDAWAAFPMTYGRLFHLRDEATITVDSGSIEHFTYSRAEATSSMLIEDAARLDVNGGQFQIWFTHRGSIRRAALDAMGTSQIDVSGGEFMIMSTSEEPNSQPDNDVYFAHAADQSTVSISGGMTRLNPELDEVVPLTVAARDEASMFISGSDFNYPLGALADLDGMLTGTLTDGNPFQWKFERDETARIVLVPEPATLPIMLLVGIMLWHLTRK